MFPSKILLVRKNISETGDVHNLIHNPDIHVSYAAGKEETLYILEKNPDISLVIMNAELEDGNGYDTAVNIRKSNTSLPILFLTHYPNLSSLRFAALLGNIHFLQHPATTEEIEKFSLRLLQENITENSVT